MDAKDTTHRGLPGQTPTVLSVITLKSRRQTELARSASSRTTLPQLRRPFDRTPSCGYYLLAAGLPKIISWRSQDDGLRLPRTHCVRLQLPTVMRDGCIYDGFGFERRYAHSIMAVVSVMLSNLTMRLLAAVVMVPTAFLPPTRSLI